MNFDKGNMVFVFIQYGFVYLQLNYYNELINLDRKNIGILFVNYYLSQKFKNRKSRENISIKAFFLNFKR